ncbi:two-component sensor histidine kinase [Ramlibacter sp. USB13]|uniref:histidine kinase n=1 Tax=Ramlibacter cellulosilyticus TaxID=2764187 RepID=A0A923MVX8_9BURK|nr:ATP-binding protein [Ramlibacter cellulosilyticus]MBC5784732.1 two-component sensor histidine kinase [Ramlibacter cellulosilyticus]
MRLPGRHRAPLALWLALSVAGGVLLARAELQRLREAFETDARIAHRLLSQRAVQHDAVLATLALLQPGDGAPEQRLPALYPQILSVQRRDAGASWPDVALAAAEARSRVERRPALADADLAAGRYRLVLAAEPASFAAALDLRQVVPWNEWPMAVDTSPVRVALENGGQQFTVQPGRGEGPWRFTFRKHLAAESQPFDVVAERTVGWAELPWRAMVAWAAAMALGVALWQWSRRQRAERERAEELLRLGQVARLNTLGELAAGMAHELNQPLAALLANTQAARRLLDDDPPELATAQGAMRQAEEQAKRAADVLARLRRGVERPADSAALQPVVLQDAVRNAFYLLEPEFARRQVAPKLQAGGASLAVQAEPVALEQIIHNLLTNALQALDQVPAQERELSVELQQDRGQGMLTVGDSGPGIAPEVLPRIFEPFFTTRENGLGLGLSLCESLAAGMGGELGVQPRAPRGAAFTLRLPLASPA